MFSRPKTNPIENLYSIPVTSTKSLTHLQKKQIKINISHALHEIEKLKPAEALALKAILSSHLTTDQIETFSHLYVLNHIKQIREIINHPNPQNRKEDLNEFPSPDTNWVSYLSFNGEIAFEPRGLLDLTALNTEEVLPVTREAVVNYTQQLINVKIAEQEEKLKKEEKIISSPTNSHQTINRTLMENRALNYHEKKALKEMGTKGLTAEMFLNRYQDSDKFTFEHYLALNHLVTLRVFTISAALDEIQDLTMTQAAGVKQGLTRQEVLSLNVWQIIALADLKQKGLTTQMLLNLGDEFAESHCYALINLVNDKKFSIQDALQEIEGLRDYQAMGVEEGLTRDDVLSLKNFWHIIALRDLKKAGLTAKMLLKYQEEGHLFQFADYCYAFIKLVTEGMKIEDALQELAGLSQYQVYVIRQGLTRQDVLGLTNFYHLLALSDFKKKGLTKERLLQSEKQGFKFESEHYYGLKEIINTFMYISIETALSKIEGLSEREVEEKCKAKNIISFVHEQKTKVSISSHTRKQMLN